MQWPSRAEYTEAVRDYPHISLQDPRLRGGRPRRGTDNFVISDTGAFSIVFPIDTVSQTFALRCWVKHVGNAKNRYERVSDYLKQFHLPNFVDFEYVSEGILVNGTEYSITRMEWVEGVSLREFIERNLQGPHIFKVVADKFQKMVDILHKHRIAHGDLQDGNILIKQNGADVELKLIDYDSLFVPTLQGQPEQIIGLPEYQHPTRIVSGGQANEKVDYFSELVIYLSFLSLAEEPELWNRVKDKTERGLLFSKKDFENPDESDIFQELENLSPDIQHLAATLKVFCGQTSIDELKPLETILPNRRPNPITDLWRYITDTFKNSKHLPHLWQHITDALKISKHFVAAGTLGLTLVICFIAFLTQMNAKEIIKAQNTELTKQLAQEKSKIQELTSSVQTIENQKNVLSRKNSELQDQLKDTTLSIDTTSREGIRLKKQLSEMETALESLVDENQKLRSQLAKKDTKLRTQIFTIRQLENEKTNIRNENQKLKEQSSESNSRNTDQNATVRQLQKEKSEVIAENQRLQGRNQNLIRQNQRLQDANKVLRTPIVSEPPRKIDVYKDDATQASVNYNDSGLKAFKDEDYNEALGHFKRTVLADSNLAVAHYNLGCAYLGIREYGNAISAFDAALNLKQEFGEAYYNRSFAYFKINRFQKASQDVKKALNVYSNYQRARDLLVVIESTQY